MKSDQEFLRNVALGAAATALVMRELAACGLRPIELERACTATKLWKTRFRGLRVPDLLCLSTGVRCEVRGKGALCIRMSDAPQRPDRRWDAGLRGQDLVAFVHVAERGDAVAASPRPAYFRVADLRAALARARATGRKAHARGAESSVSWPCTVPRAGGRVTAVGARHIAAVLEDGTPRRYRLAGRHPYLAAGERFTAGATILAGVVRRTASPAAAPRRPWQAAAALRSRDWLERWCAAKALPHLAPTRAQAVRLLAPALRRETQVRVALELAGALAQLDADQGFAYLAAAVEAAASPAAMLEAVLILAEVKGPRASAALAAVAGDRRWHGREVRQAAVWGLGRHGSADYPALVPFLADDEEDVALHSLCGFCPQAEGCADDLIARMLAAAARAAAAYSAALERIGTAAVLARLVRAWRGAPDHPWIPLTLARLPEELVRRSLAGHPLLARLEPLLLYRSREGNWLAGDGAVRKLQWLAQQSSGGAINHY